MGVCWLEGPNFRFGRKHIVPPLFIALFSKEDFKVEKHRSGRDCYPWAETNTENALERIEQILKYSIKDNRSFLALFPLHFFRESLLMQNRYDHVVLNARELVDMHGMSGADILGESMLRGVRQVGDFGEEYLHTANLFDRLITQLENNSEDILLTLIQIFEGNTVGLIRHFERAENNEYHLKELMYDVAGSFGDEYGWQLWLLKPEEMYLDDDILNTRMQELKIPKKLSDFVIRNRKASCYFEHPWGIEEEPKKPKEKITQQRSGSFMATVPILLRSDLLNADLTPKKNYDPSYKIEELNEMRFKAEKIYKSDGFDILNFIQEEIHKDIQFSKILLKFIIDDHDKNDMLLDNYLSYHLAFLFSEEEYLAMLSVYSTTHNCKYCRGRWLDVAYLFPDLFRKNWIRWYNTYDHSRLNLVLQAIRLGISIPSNELEYPINLCNQEHEPLKTRLEERILMNTLLCFSHSQEALIKGYLEGKIFDNIYEKMQLTPESFSLYKMTALPVIDLIQYLYSSPQYSDDQFLLFEVLIYRLETQDSDRLHLKEVFDNLIKLDEMENYPLYIILSLCIRLQKVKMDKETREAYYSLWYFLIKTLNITEDDFSKYILLFQEIQDEDLFDTMQIMLPFNVTALTPLKWMNKMVSLKYPYEGDVKRCHFNPSIQNINYLNENLTINHLQFLEEYPVYSVGVILRISLTDGIAYYPDIWPNRETSSSDMKAILELNLLNLSDNLDLLRNYPSVESFDIIMKILGRSDLDEDLLKIVIRWLHLRDKHILAIIISNIGNLVNQVNIFQAFAILHEMRTRHQDILDHHQILGLSLFSHDYIRAYMVSTYLPVPNYGKERIRMIFASLSPFIPILYKEGLFRIIFRSFEGYVQKEMMSSSGLHFTSVHQEKIAHIFDVEAIGLFLIETYSNFYVYEKAMRLHHFYWKSQGLNKGLYMSEHEGEAKEDEK
ncbi:MAG: hypothetical protein INQ03_00865 [Candidatus Heimdallarchaeota archaeon]|nr:hypothetical protein [Candidatus Heimdallarchaeota archaeon]